jgi:hypothetical protein
MGTMKTRASTVIFAAVLACVSFLPMARGEDSAEKDPPHQSAFRKWLELLPGGDQTKLKAVHALAMEDAAVKAAEEKRKQAEKEFHDVLRATMLRIDPSVQPILDKMPEPKKHHHKW